MRSIFFFQILFLLSPFLIAAQEINIAIIDFENKTENPKYSGLGKAMSSMLISDLSSNLSSKKIGFIERLQINKVLGEQKIQKQLFIDQNSTVRAGKILGVKYLLLGDVFVMNNDLIINARLTDVESGQIKFSKKQEGTIAQWLNLKSSIAKELTSALNLSFVNPIKVEKDISPSTLSSYSQVIEAKDNNDLPKAENLIKSLANSDLGMNYLNGLKKEINSIKKEVAENSIKIKNIESVNARQDVQISALEKSGGRVINAKSYKELYHNLQSDLNSPSEKKQILVSMLNNYPDQFSENLRILMSWAGYGEQARSLKSMNDGQKYLIELCKVTNNRNLVNNLIVHNSTLNAYYYQFFNPKTGSEAFEDFNKHFQIFKDALYKITMDSTSKSLLMFNYLKKFVYYGENIHSSKGPDQYKNKFITPLRNDFKYQYLIISSIDSLLPIFNINEPEYLKNAVLSLKSSVFNSSVTSDEIWKKIFDLTFILNYLLREKMNSLKMYPQPLLNDYEDKFKYELIYIWEYNEFQMMDIADARYNLN